MADLSLSGKLPSDDRNGLSALAASLLANPKEVRVAIVLFDVNRITEEPDTGARVPQVRIRAFEPITPSDDAHEMDRLLRRSVERRTGKVELPLDLERELDKLVAAPEPGDGKAEQ